MKRVPGKLASDAAMVMAAGLGKRMRPLTASRPKPLIPVLGKPLVDHALDKLAEAGVGRAVVNVHYMADALEAHLALRNAPAITISDERDALLETGGGMVKAMPHLPDPFFCLNSDNIWLDGPRDVFAELSTAWNPVTMDALLLMVRHTGARNYDGKGDFHLDPLGKVSRRRAGRVARGRAGRWSPAGAPRVREADHGCEPAGGGAGHLPGPRRARERRTHTQRAPRRRTSGF